MPKTTWNPTGTPLRFPLGAPAKNALPSDMPAPLGLDGLDHSPHRTDRERRVYGTTSQAAPTRRGRGGRRAGADSRPTPRWRAKHRYPSAVPEGGDLSHLRSCSYAASRRSCRPARGGTRCPRCPCRLRTSRASGRASCRLQIRRARAPWRSRRRCRRSRSRSSDGRSVLTLHQRRTGLIAHLRHPVVHSRHAGVSEGPAEQTAPEGLGSVDVLGRELNMHNFTGHRLLLSGLSMTLRLTDLQRR